MPRLGVNIDHVATVRQARGVMYPDPVTAVGIVELAGADGIVCHLREDRRHIRDRDLRILREIIQTRLNLEMAATEEMIRIALATKPNLVTLVPEKREELTTEGGLDVIKFFPSLKKAIQRLHKGAIPVSLFVDPKKEQIKASEDVGADAIEIHTGHYCDAKTPSQEDEELKKIFDAVAEATHRNLQIAAGHGLNYVNVQRIAEIKEIEELNIGHSIIARAVLVGLDRAVREMIALIK
ncbi:MAG: pyridoxine 5'-phosphate synthase [Desulfobacterales bacterium]|jgi:pyridoxine 5-phosphate synthase|nr:pyridoxine 5'-phosphate synthase [Desulfobacterales bacterium]